ncbi:cation-transporting P-type ATPase [[Actinomadura] parvosata]|uniref:cation-transporting P-type ATPase n=1 Tax=[Actinomadura] parvosata TaxID=1955412 RepID=UPI00406D5018
MICPPSSGVTYPPGTGVTCPLNTGLACPRNIGLAWAPEAGDTRFGALRLLESGPRGLTEAQAEHRLLVHGENIVPAHRPVSWPRRLARSLRDPFTMVLLALGVVSALIASWGTAGVFGLLALPAVSYEWLLLVAVLYGGGLLAINAGPAGSQNETDREPHRDSPATGIATLQFYSCARRQASWRQHQEGQACRLGSSRGSSRSCCGRWCAYWTAARGR